MGLAQRQGLKEQIIITVHPEILPGVSNELVKQGDVNVHRQGVTDVF